MSTAVLEKRNKNANKTRIDWDLNIYCPEQWYGEVTFWDPDLWKINARIYMEGEGRSPIDTEYTITLLEKEARAIGLVAWGRKVEDPEADLHNESWDDWLDAGLDGFIDLYNFNLLYRDKCSERIVEFLDTLPQYLEDVPERMMW